MVLRKFLKNWKTPNKNNWKNRRINPSKFLRIIPDILWEWKSWIPVKIFRQFLSKFCVRFWDKFPWRISWKFLGKFLQFFLRKIFWEFYRHPSTNSQTNYQEMSRGVLDVLVESVKQIPREHLSKILKEFTREIQKTTHLDSPVKISSNNVKIILRGFQSRFLE